MPDLTLDEADRCPYCNKILRDPPNCCPEMIEDSDKQFSRKLRQIEEDDNYNY
jgi:predicted amidophosphoribosyltransferase